MPLSAVSASALTTMRVVPVGDPRGGPSLLVIREGVAEQVALEGRDSWTIGRAPECDIVIDDRSLSRRHAVLRGGGRWTLEDLGSVNGTKVSGQPIAAQQPAVVRGGELLELGLVLLVLQPGGEAEAEAEAAPGGAPMEALHRLLDRVAQSDLSVLLLGETGVGKEVFAEEVHQRSPRRGGPLVKIHCAAIPETLIESELFGHEKGSFTGASAKKGLIESASGGTVFLDEIGEMPPSMQAKLLRVLQERKVRPVGGSVEVPVDVRVVAATHRDLRAEVEAGRFRQDLYFRLNGISLQIPPLRERRAEIGPLAARFAEEAARRLGRPAPQLTAEALAKLAGHGWPGNVRELKNTVERAVVLCDGDRIEPDLLQLDDAGAPAAGPDAPLRQGRAAAERAMILDALQRAGGNQTEAARLLGVSRRTLLYKLDAYGIERPRKGRLPMKAAPEGNPPPTSERFELRQPLGQGGSGVVYEALDRSSGQRVAVKAIAAGSPEAARLGREIEARARVAHPNLVELRELVEEGPWCFLVMDLVEGSPFVAHTRRDDPGPEPPRPLPSGPVSIPSSTTEPLMARSLPRCPADPERLRPALLQLASGLDALHQAGVVHRDIKDANVLVGHDGRLHILDFGLAVALHASPRTLDDPSAGTPAYLSPEQASGQPPSPASDWYSVGVLLYEALTGRLPFVGDPVVLLMAKRAAPPPPPSAIVADPPGDLEQLCLSLLARDPALRPSGAQVIEALGGRVSPAGATGEPAKSEPAADRPAKGEPATSMTTGDAEAPPPTTRSPPTSAPPAPRALTPDAEIVGEQRQAELLQIVQRAGERAPRPEAPADAPAEAPADAPPGPGANLARGPRPVGAWLAGALLALLIAGAIGLRMASSPPSAPTAPASSTRGDRK